MPPASLRGSAVPCSVSLGAIWKRPCPAQGSSWPLPTEAMPAAPPHYQNLAIYTQHRPTYKTLDPFYVNWRMAFLMLERKRKRRSPGKVARTALPAEQAEGLAWLRAPGAAERRKQDQLARNGCWGRGWLTPFLAWAGQAWSLPWAFDATAQVSSSASAGNDNTKYSFTSQLQHGFTLWAARLGFFGTGWLDPRLSLSPLCTRSVHVVSG